MFENRCFIHPQMILFVQTINQNKVNVSTAWPLEQVDQAETFLAEKYCFKHLWPPKIILIVLYLFGMWTRICGGPPVTWPASCQLTWHVQVQGGRGRGRKSWRRGVGRGVVGEGGELESRADRRGRCLKNTSNWKIIFAMMCSSRKENYSEN